MLEDPEIQKTIWGTVTAFISGAVGYVYHKYHKIQQDISDRPTKDQVEELIDIKLKIIQLQHNHIIEKLEDVHSSVERLENIIINGKK